MEKTIILGVAFIVSALTWVLITSAIWWEATLCPNSFVLHGKGIFSPYQEHILAPEVGSDSVESVFAC